jgi:hypothetical protein
MTKGAMWIFVCFTAGVAACGGAPQPGPAGGQTSNADLGQAKGLGQQDDSCGADNDCDDGLTCQEVQRHVSAISVVTRFECEPAASDTPPPGQSGDACSQDSDCDDGLVCALIQVHVSAKSVLTRLGCTQPKAEEGDSCAKDSDCDSGLICKRVQKHVSPISVVTQFLCQQR